MISEEELDATIIEGMNKPAAVPFGGGQPANTPPAKPAAPVQVKSTMKRTKNV